MDNLTNLTSPNRPHRLDVRPSLAIVAGFLLMAGALAGCGNDVESASSTTTSTTEKTTTTEAEDATTTTADPGGLSGTNVGLGSKLGEEAGSLPGLGADGSDDAFGPDVVACLDDEASGLSPTDASALTGGEDFSVLSPDGLEIVTTALDTCVPPDEMADQFSKEFSASLGREPDPKFTQCLSTELNGQVGAVLVEAANAAATGSEDIPQPVLDVLDACGDIIIGDLFVDQFTETGIPADAAQCMADGLSGKLTMSDLIALGQGGEPPASLEAEIESVATSCGAGG